MSSDSEIRAMAADLPKYPPLTLSGDMDVKMCYPNLDEETLWRVYQTYTIEFGGTMTLEEHVEMDEPLKKFVFLRCTASNLLGAVKRGKFTATVSMGLMKYVGVDSIPLEGYASFDDNGDILNRDLADMGPIVVKTTLTDTHDDRSIVPGLQKVHLGELSVSQVERVIFQSTPTRRTIEELEKGGIRWEVVNAQ